MSIMETKNRSTNLTLRTRDLPVKPIPNPSRSLLVYERSIVDGLNITFDNMESLFESIGIITGVVDASRMGQTIQKHVSRTKRDVTAFNATHSPLVDIFHKQFQVLSGSLKRCRGFIVGDLVQLEQQLCQELSVEHELETRFRHLESSLGNPSHLSLGTFTPSPPPIASPTVDEISQILTLRDKLLSQLDD
jgi:hypothetical protein